MANENNEETVEVSINELSDVLYAAECELFPGRMVTLDDEPQSERESIEESYKSLFRSAFPGDEEGLEDL